MACYVLLRSWQPAPDGRAPAAAPAALAAFAGVRAVYLAAHAGYVVAASRAAAAELARAVHGAAALGYPVPLACTVLPDTPVRGDGGAPECSAVVLQWLLAQPAAPGPTPAPLSRTSRRLLLGRVAGLLPCLFVC